jgi:hypothetical protein
VHRTVKLNQSDQKALRGSNILLDGEPTWRLFITFHAIIGFPLIVADSGSSINDMVNDITEIPFPATLPE